MGKTIRALRTRLEVPTHDEHLLSVPCIESDTTTLPIAGMLLEPHLQSPSFKMTSIFQQAKYLHPGIGRRYKDI